MGSSLRRKALSSQSQKFAEQVVDGAAILDDNTAQLLVEAFAAVPREQFIEQRARAFEDMQLSVGFGQTSPRPSTIARMLGVLGLSSGMRILELGCGSGYCSALMAAAGASVFALEEIGLLAQRARKTLDALGYQNVIVRPREGKRGWSEHAPFDAIIVWQPCLRMPAELMNQLSTPSGRLLGLIGTAASARLTMWQVTVEGVSNYQLENIALT